MQRAAYPHLVLWFVMILLGNSFTWASSNSFDEKHTHVTRSPMPGRVINIFVKKGQEIFAGNELLCVEVMKMETTIRSDFSGTVTEIYCQKGDTVESDTLLISILATIDSQAPPPPPQQPSPPSGSPTITRQSHPPTISPFVNQNLLNKLSSNAKAHTPLNYLSKTAAQEPLSKTPPAAEQEVVKEMSDVCLSNPVAETVPQAPTALLARVAPALSKTTLHMQQFVLHFSTLQEIASHDIPHLPKLLFQAQHTSFAPALEQKSLPSLTLVSSNYAGNMLVKKLTYVLGMARLSAKDQSLLRRIPHLQLRHIAPSDHGWIHPHVQQSSYADALLLLALALTLLTSAYTISQLLRRPTHLPASSETQLPTYITIYLPPRFPMWK